ncbi:hypothetical protein B0T11DRAFT_50650 [Plectosphaerella cucumerina]|uniref:Uncharacterized protein n=1 Tax=Plectosphaerella cucumerina TaxID=40658 RepID=A0A8K0TKB2_9PEZI|nr:hypothetical protein B0T11DRAFT_50650 [Plectosphaerella cucumerina]
MAHQITDEELDRDWKPSGRRPQSTIARTFSQELMDIFRIENSVADLDEKLNERKQTVQTQTSELESLEKRIKEMEARLQRGGVHARTPLNTTTTTTQQTEAPRPPSTDDQLQQIQDKARSRPGTARQNQAAAPSSANMPPTPTASEDGDRS